MKQQKLLFAIHPVITDLKINENGSVIFYKGKQLDIKVYQKPRNNYPNRLVNFMGRTHRVTKLILEAWVGMRSANQVARRHGSFENDHFTNLYWGVRGAVSGYKNTKAKRSSLSKIKEEDIPTILKRVASEDPNDTLTQIAKDYNTGAMSIYRLKKRYAL